MKHHQDKDLYVITTARKRDDLDWQKTGAQFGLGKADGTVAGVLTVDSWNNIQKYGRVRNAFFIFDEQKLVGKGAWVKTFLQLARANRWILLSGTPGETWLDFAPIFIANGYYRNRTDFVRQHVVYKQYVNFPSIDRYVDTGTLVGHRKRVLVRMPYARRTTRHVKTIPVRFDSDSFTRVKEERWNIYENQPIKDVGELFRVMRKLSNSDKSRLVKLLELWEKHPKLIVFYNFDYELEMLRACFESLHGSNNLSTLKMNVFEKFTNDDSTALSEYEKLATHELSMALEQSWRMLRGSSCGPSGAKGKCIGMKDSSTTLRTNSEKVIGSKTKVGPSGSGDSTSIGINTDGSKLTTGSADCPAEDSFEIAEWNGHKHESVPTGDRWIYLVQYTAGAEAWNCTTTDATVFYSLTYSYKVFEQCQGRIDRLNTPFKDLYYYILRSNTFIDNSIWRSIMKKEDFSEVKTAKNL